jgi:hypothetical protein
MADLDKEQYSQPLLERRHNSIDRGEVFKAFSEHYQGCSNTQGHKELTKEIQELWKKVTLIEVLDHRVSAVEDAIDTIVVNINTTMVDIHKIQTTMAENNVLRLWTGRIVIGLLSALVTFLTAKYT